jgi:hypothetical protein
MSIPFQMMLFSNFLFCFASFADALRIHNFGASIEPDFDSGGFDFDSRFFASREEMDKWMETERESGYLPAVANGDIELKKTGSSLANDFTCHQYLRVDMNKLNENIRTGPVLAKMNVDASPHHYVFATGLAYTGTTALYGLLSTSPTTSNQCAGHGNCCEGSWQLFRKHILDFKNRHDPTLPKDWNEAVEALETTWDLSKPILLDKSPDYVHRTDRLVDTLRASGKKVSIIYVARTPCFHQGKRYADGLERMMTTIRNLRSSGAHLHIVKYEELLLDPYAVAEQLLAFLPRLKSLDPSKNGLHDAPYVRSGSNRGKPVTEYIQSRDLGNKIRMGGNHNFTITTAQEKYLKELGYTSEWWNSVGIDL